MEPLFAKDFMSLELLLVVEHAVIEDVEFFLVEGRKEPIEPNPLKDTGAVFIEDIDCSLLLSDGTF